MATCITPDQTTYYTIRQRRSDETLTEDGRNKALLRAAGEGQTDRVRKLIRDGGDVDYSDPDDGFTALHHAVLSGFEDTAEELLAAGADINAVTVNLLTPLALAALKARSNVVDMLLSRRALVARVGRQSVPLLHAACCSGNVEFVQTLFQTPSVRSQIALWSHVQLDRIASFLKLHHTAEVADGVVLPFHVAACFGHVDIVKYLLDSGSDINAPFEITFDSSVTSPKPGNDKGTTSKESGWTALMIATRNGRDSTVQLLLERGSDVLAETCVSDPDLIFETALSMALGKSEISCLSYLLQWYADNKLRPQVRDYPDPMQYSIMQGYVGCVELLMSYGFNANDVYERGHTCLIYAAEHGHSQVIELLLRSGARLDATTVSGNTALMLASKNGHVDCIRALIAFKADVSLTHDMEKRSALFLAARNGHSKCLEAIADAGGDVNACDFELKTPLIAAAEGGHDACVKALLKRHADALRVNEKGRFALYQASAAGHLACVEILVEHGGLDKVGGSRRKTPLMMAAENGHSECVKVLLRQDPNTIRKLSGLSKSGAIHYAAYSGSVDCVRLLIEQGADINMRTKSGETPLDRLQENKDMENDKKRESLEALKKMGAKSGKKRNFWR